MAALKQVRFTLATDDAIEELRNGAKKSTPPKVSFWSSVWKTWCQGMSIIKVLEIKEHIPVELSRLYSRNSMPK